MTMTLRNRASSVVLACCLTLANTACVCALPAQPTGDSGSTHAHHDSAHAAHSGHHEATEISMPCAHDECGDCPSLEISAKSSWDGHATTPKQKVSDDAGVADIAGSFEPPLLLAHARGSPGPAQTPRPPSTPVTLADVLLR